MVPHDVGPTVRVLKIGLWTEIQSNGQGGLMKTSLIQQGLAADIRQWMVWRAIAGASAQRSYRSSIHEVSATDLPVLLEFAVRPSTACHVLPRLQRHLAGAGILVAGLATGEGKGECGEWDVG
ncbi:hypothetical protein D2Q93_16510, partial [Alicyclobacillaceae bacterium I2511]